MTEVIKKTDNFLKINGMCKSRIDFSSHVERFISEMEAGLRGAPGSLLMLPSYIPEPKAPPKNRRVIALDAGGTNLRVAAISFSEAGQARVESNRRLPMPGVGTEVSSKVFFSALADALAPVAAFGDEIGFCFSFPFKSQPDGDGRIITLTKELSVEDAEGALVGWELNTALKAAGIREKRIVVLNDTVAAMLGGMSFGRDRYVADHIGLVLGTGTNMCYFENPEKIAGANAAAFEGRMAVNLESGGFDAFPRGRFDLDLDGAAAVSNGQKYEKMVSGRYLGTLILLTLKGMAESGLFSVESAKSLLSLEGLDTAAADGFASGGDEGFLCSVFVSKQDKEAAIYASRALFSRAAKLVAITLCALISRQAGNQSPFLPVRVAAEGGLIGRSALFRSFLDAELQPRLKERGLRCEFVVTENQTLIGSARAALCGRPL